MINKVVVSAAGQGTRMLELSKDKSKHLINVKERPFLAYLLDNILKAGYKEIILVVGFREDMIKEFLKTYMNDRDRSYNPVVRSEHENKVSSSSLSSDYKSNRRNHEIKIVNQFEILGPKEKEYGTACPIKCVKDLVEGESFISLCGDNFYSIDDLKSMNVEDDFNYIGGVENDHPEKYGVLIKDDGFLKEIIEKPKEFVGNLINTSLYKFTPEVFEKLSLISKSPRGEYEITDVISILAKERKVKIKELKDYWMDFGRPEDVKKFEEFLKDDLSKVS